MSDKNQHEQTKKKLKTIGITLLIVGGIFTLIGFIDFFAAFGGHGMPTMFWCAFLGLPMVGIGGSLTSVAYKREISRYMKNESVPVINEASKELSPAIRNLTDAVKDGLNTNEQIRCSCGKENEKGSKFCAECGKALSFICPNCGENLENDSVFCNHCGHKL